jgi:isopenicillin N synthase-like dioxygenase
MENLKREKVKFKNGLEGYLKMYEIKENELLRHLAEKLKLSEKFVKSFQF